MTPNEIAGEREVLELEQRYLEMAPPLQSAGSEVAELLGTLASRMRLPLGCGITSRIKPFESVARKLDKLRWDSSRLVEIQDLTGVRVVLQYRRDIALLCEMVGSVFEVRRAYEPSHPNGAENFGYSSQHFVVQLPIRGAVDANMPSNQPVLVEIQVRSLAQHVWAATSHDLHYRNEASVPTDARRAMSRLAALLELVDIEIDRVLKEREDYRGRVATLSRFPQELLNVELLANMLDDLLPAGNKVASEPYGELLQLLIEDGITTTGALTQLWESHRADVLADEATRVAHARRFYSVSTHHLLGDPARSNKGVHFSHFGLIRIALKRKSDALSS